MKTITVILIAVSVVLLHHELEAQIPRILDYQGVLTDSLGSPKPDGTYSFTFRLYESPVGGSPIWSEAKALLVIKGLFYTALGDQVVIGPSVAFDRAYWLGIQVASNPELVPRMPLTTSAYSITSVRADTARFALTAPQQGFVDSARIAGTIPNNSVTTAKIADGAVTGAKIGNGQVVRRVNGIADGVTLSAQGGATITSSNDTIIINAGTGGGGTGVQGIQNTNNTLDVINPNGPTVTVNAKNGGIGTTQLADNSVTSAKISDGTIQFTDVGQNGAAGGQVIKWSGTAWQPGSDNIGTGVFLPLSGGTITGAITSIGGPLITMGKGNFGSGNTNAGTNAFVAGQNNTSSAYGASVVGGSNNSATLDNASVGGGIGNLANGISSHVGGGDGNTASGNTSIVSGGLGNNATATSATISGGENNSASATGSTIGGGRLNRARGLYSVVSGGGGATLVDSNSALGDYSTIGGGIRNRVSAGFSTVSGGSNNNASSPQSTISGGSTNNAGGFYSTVSGGSFNTATALGSTIGGGSPNRARGQYSVVSGGGGPSFSDSNSVLGDNSTIGGGRSNQSGGRFSTVSGGDNNNASGFAATIIGGVSNNASGDYSTVLGGQLNIAQNLYSLAAGWHARALHRSSFVWSDYTISGAESDTTDQFKIQASNGVSLASSAGSTKRIRLGDYYRDNANVAWGNINGDGTIGSSFGVSSVTRNSAGNYTIALHVTTGNANTLIPLASAEVDGIPASAAAARLVYVDQASTTSFNVYITNGNYVAQDNEFIFIVTAR